MNSYRYSLSITSQFYFCGIPFRLDTSPKCSLDCLYCFAMTRGGRRTRINQIANTSSIREKFIRAFSQSRKDINGEFIENRVPVHFGGMSDPFSNDSVLKVSLELLDILIDYEYPTVLSTKQTNTITQPSILNKLEKMRNIVIQVSLPTNDSCFSDAIEPNIPSPHNRINALRLLSQAGFHTIVRLQPLLPTQVETVTQELIPMLGEAGVKHVVVEFLKLPVETKISNISVLFNALNWDGMEYYKKHFAIRTGREWILPPIYKWELLQPVIEAIHRCGMTFGAGDYGLNHMGDTDCCCGISNISGFTNWFQHNIPFLIRKSGDSVSYVEEDGRIGGSIRMYMNSHCRENELHSISDYLRRKWNRPGTENAPDTFLGIKYSGERDNTMNCVYNRVPF